MDSLRPNNKLPIEYTWPMLMDALNEHGHRLRVGNNTVASTMRDGVHIRLALHNNNIAVIGPRTAYVSDGGFPTTTTADRLRRVLGPSTYRCRITQHPHNIIVSHPHDTARYIVGGRALRVTHGGIQVEQLDLGAIVDSINNNDNKIINPGRKTSK